MLFKKYLTLFLTIIPFILLSQVNQVQFGKNKIQGLAVYRRHARLQVFPHHAGTNPHITDFH